jgi:hypothetical protein
VPVSVIANPSTTRQSIVPFAPVRRFTAEEPPELRWTSPPETRTEEIVGAAVEDPSWIIASAAVGSTTLQWLCSNRPTLAVRYARPPPLTGAVTLTIQRSWRTEWIVSVPEGATFSLPSWRPHHWTVPMIPLKTTLRCGTWVP